MTLKVFFKAGFMEVSAFADKVLLGRIRKGDQKAWEEFVGHYQSRLFYLAFKRIKDRDLCDDLVQEAFLGFITNLDKVDEERNYESYLYGILQRRIMDRLRKDYRAPGVENRRDSSGNPAQIEVPDSATGVSTWYRNEERRKIENDALAEALARIIKGYVNAGDYQKLKVMELLWVKGMENIEVSRLLNMDNRTVASIKHRALEDIKSTLQEKNLSPSSFPGL